MPGRYGSIHTWHLLATDGRPSARITLRSYPGTVATVIGYVDIESSYTTLSHVRIDGSNRFYDQRQAAGCPTGVSQSLVIAGRDDILEYDDYYQSVARLRANGIGIGFWGDADDTIIRHDTIHDVGQCQAYDHLIYVSHGNNVRIYDNWMWNDPHGRGVQLYPAPTNARVYNNVIVRVGEGFGIGNEPGDTVSGNEVYNNIVAHATGLPWESIPGMCINDSYGGTPGNGNVFARNDCYRDPGGIARVSAITMYENTTVNPRFVNEAGHDYALMPTSSLRKQGSQMDAALLPTGSPIAGGPGGDAAPPPLPTSVPSPSAPLPSAPGVTVPAVSPSAVNAP
jgi:Right handed beta helix region